MAKYYPTLGHGVWFPERLCDFIDKHMECSPHFGSMDLNGDRCFDLFTDSSILSFAEVARDKSRDV